VGGICVLSGMVLKLVKNIQRNGSTITKAPSVKKI
jgi:hypothetical protein